MIEERWNEKRGENLRQKKHLMQHNYSHDDYMRRACEVSSRLRKEKVAKQVKDKRKACFQLS